MQDLVDILSRSIMEKHEAEVYVLLYRVGPQTIGTISKLLRKSRTNLYYQVEKMVDKGFLVDTKLGRTSKYSAQNIEKLIDDLKYKAQTLYQREILEISNLEEAKEQIEEISKFSYFKPNIDIFTGELSLKKMYEQALLDEYCYTYFTPWYNRPDLIEIDNWHTEQRVKRGQPVKIILSQTKEAQDFINTESKYRETKIINKSIFPFKDIAMITDKRFLIFSEADNIAVCIHNQFVAQNQSVIFEYIWNTGH